MHSARRMGAIEAATIVPRMHNTQAESVARSCGATPNSCDLSRVTDADFTCTPRERVGENSIDSGGHEQHALVECQQVPYNCIKELYLLIQRNAMAEATLSTKNQIVIPREAREALGVKPGDKLLVIVRGEKVIIRQKPESQHEAIKGLSRGSYSDEYLKKERRSWD